jgi:hypothetical protein
MQLEAIARIILVRNQLLLSLLALEEIEAQRRIRKLEPEIGPGRGHAERKEQRHFPAKDVYGTCSEQGDAAFLTYTRFTQSRFDELLNELRPAIEANRHVRMNVPEPTGNPRACKATTANRLLMTLKFLACGGNCDQLGVEFGVHEHVVSEDLLHIVWAICGQLAYEIHFPAPGAETEARRGTVSAAFPSAIGIIDCTHTPSPRQHGDFSGHHWQHERGHQVVCDPLGFVLHVTAGLAGSRHDSYRYRASEVAHLLEAADADVMGDSAYESMRRVVPPPRHGSEEAKIEHTSKRSRIEQFFSVLKQWFTVAGRKWHRTDRDFLATCFLPAAFCTTAERG